MTRKPFYKKTAHLLSLPAAQLLLIFGVIVLCYAHTLDVPFYLDDNGSLRNNPAIQSGDLGILWNTYAARIVGYITFAVDYSLHGYAVTGYHLVNIGIHVLATLFVFLVSRTLLRTPVMSARHDKSATIWLPLLAALLFAVHPLQTQAVTYIVQRLASLAALFYLASLYSYLQFRLSQGVAVKALYVLLALLTFAMAFSTKQNAITLPAAWALLELVFFRPNRKSVLVVLGACAILAVLLLFLAPLVLHQPLLDFVDARTRETQLFTRLQYLSVQVHVLWEYLGKFLLPVNLTLNYENPVPTGFFTPLTVLLALLHVAVLVVAVMLVRRQPLVAFGILFYYTAQLVESSIIPIRDVGFDHRTYLPNVGLCLIAAQLLTSLIARMNKPRYAWLVALYVAVLAGLTWQRNDTWRDPVAFFSHETRVDSDSFRAHCLLGQAYYEQGNIPEAITAFRQAWPLRASRIERGNNTYTSCATNFAATLQEGRQLDAADELIASLPLADFPAFDRSKLTGILGNIEALRENYDRAEELFTQARQINPQNIDAIANLAKLKLLTEELDESYALFKQVNEMDPNNRDGIIGLEYLEQLRQQQ